MKGKNSVAFFCFLTLTYCANISFAAGSSVQSEDYKKGSELVEKRAYKDAIPYFDKK